MGKVSNESLLVYEWLKKNAARYTVHEAQKLLKLQYNITYTEDALYQRARRAGVKYKPDIGSTDLKGHIKQAEEKTEQKKRAKHLDEAVTKIKELEAHVEAIKKLKSSSASLAIRPSKGANTSEATVIAVATDWHCGERISSAQVSGLNEFSVAIFRERAGKFFERVVRLTEKERQDIHIEELILFLGGDQLLGLLSPLIRWTSQCPQG